VIVFVTSPTIRPVVEDDDDECEAVSKVSGKIKGNYAEREREHISMPLCSQ
jgi:hypothetical protein